MTDATAPRPEPTIAVVGAGGVGAFFAAHLSTVQANVVACVRRPFDTYVIDSPEHPLTAPAAAVTNPDQIPWEGPADWVFVGLKAHQSEAAAPWFDRLCDDRTRVVAMQNGVEAVERLTPLVHGAAVTPSVVYCGAELVDPGHVFHTRSARLIMPETADARDAETLFAGTDMTIDPSPTHLRSAWVKLAINSVANGLTALTGKPMGVLADPGIAEIAIALMTEAHTVGRAEGADLDLDGIPDRITAFGKMTENRTSMLQDTEAGRPTEHDAIHGAVVRAGARHGIPTPTTDIVLRLLAARS